MTQQPGQQHEFHRLKHQLEAQKDPYHARQKLPEPTLCPDCHAVYQHGRWHWAPAPPQAHEHVCPACQRIRDRFPAGFLTLSGAYLRQHRDDIVQLVRNEARNESVEHPLARIIDIEEEGDQAVVTTTDLRLAHRMADAVQQAHRGELDVKFSEDEYRVRIHWSR